MWTAILTCWGEKQDHTRLPLEQENDWNDLEVMNKSEVEGKKRKKSSTFSSNSHFTAAQVANSLTPSSQKDLEKWHRWEKDGRIAAENVLTTVIQTHSLLFVLRSERWTAQTDLFFSSTVSLSRWFRLCTYHSLFNRSAAIATWDSLGNLAVDAFFAAHFQSYCCRPHQMLDAATKHRFLLDFSPQRKSSFGNSILTISASWPGR